MAPVPTLLVLPRYPHPESGTGQRSLLFLDAAARLGPVHVVLTDGSGPLEQLRARPGVGSVSALASPRITPAGRLGRATVGATRLIVPDLAYRPDPALRGALTALAGTTGARAVIFRYTAPHCAAGLDDRPGLRVMVDVDDRDDQKYASRLARRFGTAFTRFGPAAPFLSRLRAVLRRKLARAGLVWFAAPDDVWPLGGVETRVLSNAPHAAPDTPPPLDPETRAVLFVGSFAHRPNQDGVRWFLEHCWADIRAACPAARFRIVGSGDWPRLAADFPRLDGVDYVGRVADLEAEYAAARVCICPVREGGGSKIKVIEAAAFARPVVGSSHALRGFDPRLTAHAVGSDSPAAQVAACIGYLRDARRAEADGRALHAVQQAAHSRAAAIDAIRGDITLALAGEAQDVTPARTPPEPPR
ncbi:Glycosyltransferase involved in cell wall bisynthesis [Rhodovulum sp. ES.010]|uniref:glycosyltransferase n=1 Tax=Rhodovulum sp. ES.010 TaxID=1882821 RepID=UPI000927C3E2|nr:glycosyltransferase [Rhodovulum sp. ES.010]SIO59879.1 Glycosyltransferase involved in cell wall bisynthesis [Rhodovulum sp. ES.010]